MNSTNPEKFRLTFKNSLWQYLVALLLYVPLQFVFSILIAFLVVSFDLPLEAETGSDLSTVLAFIAVLTIGYQLSYRSWKKKQAKAA